MAIPEVPDQGTTNAAGGPVHEWRIKPSPPCVFTDARLRIFYRAKHAGWFEIVFLTNRHYLGRRIPRCPLKTELHYALDAGLVEACRSLDLLPKEEE